jgi:hypothetical protein
MRFEAKRKGGPLPKTSKRLAMRPEKRAVEDEQLGSALRELRYFLTASFPGLYQQFRIQKMI